MKINKKIEKYLNEEVLNAGAVNDISQEISKLLEDLNYMYINLNVKGAKQIFKNIKKEMKKLEKELNRN